MSNERWTHVAGLVSCWVPVGEGLYKGGPAPSPPGPPRWTLEDQMHDSGAEHLLPNLDWPQSAAALSMRWSENQCVWIACWNTVVGPAHSTGEVRAATVVLYARSGFESGHYMGIFDHGRRHWGGLTSETSKTVGATSRSRNGIVALSEKRRQAALRTMGQTDGQRVPLAPASAGEVNVSNQLWTLQRKEQTWSATRGRPLVDASEAAVWRCAALLKQAIAGQARPAWATLSDRTARRGVADAVVWVLAGCVCVGAPAPNCSERPSQNHHRVAQNPSRDDTVSSGV